MTHRWEWFWCVEDAPLCCVNVFQTIGETYPMTTDFRFAVVLIAGCLCLDGCSRSGLSEISGTVAYDGQPIQAGTISLLPADGNGPTAAGVIADGKYAMKVVPGKKKVQIEGFKVVGRRRHNPQDSNSPMVDIREPIVPEQYNTKSTLTQEVTSSVRVYDFDLKK